MKAFFEIIKTIIIVVIAGIIINGIIEYIRGDVYCYNIIDMRSQYKNYIVLDKYVEEPRTFVFRLKNPITRKVRKVYVKDYIYDNVYFVGDTIK